MATGLRCYDPSGRLLLDFTDRVAKIADYGLVTTPSTVSVPGMRPDGNWLVVADSDVVIVIGNDHFTIQLQAWLGSVATLRYTVVRL